MDRKGLLFVTLWSHGRAGTPPFKKFNKYIYPAHTAEGNLVCTGLFLPCDCDGTVCADLYLITILYG